MPAVGRRAHRTSGHVYALACAVGAIALWSTNAAAAGIALGNLTLPQVLALQFGSAAAAFAVARRVRQAHARVDRENRRLTPRAAGMAVIGLTGAIALQYLAFATAPLIAANAIAYAWPLMVAAWAALCAGRRGSRASLAFAVVGFAGMVLIFAGRGNGGGDGTSPLGYAAALGSAASMAWYTTTIGRVAADRIDMLLVATLAGAAVAVPIAIAQTEPSASIVPIAAGIYTGLGPMAGGYALWTRSMTHPDGARLAPIAYATPMLSTLILLLGGESLPALGLVGCGLIVLCAGGVVIDLRRPKHARHQPPGRSRRISGRDLPAASSVGETAAGR
jgi:drug/metabolite transporter (DMT)-like permease